MKLRLLILLAAALAAAPAAGQTVKSLGYNTTNGQVVYSGTNPLTFTNSVGFATNARAATRTNLGGTTVGNAVFTATNAAAAATAIGLGWSALTNPQSSLYSGTATQLLGYVAETNPSGSGLTGFNVMAYTNTNTLVIPANLLIAEDAVPAARNARNVTVNGAVTIQYPYSSPTTIYGNNSITATDDSTYTNTLATWNSNTVTFATNVSVAGTLAVSNTATFSTNVTVNGNLSVGSLTTTTPSTWALDATQTAAATNGRLTLPSNANVIRLTNNNAISSVTNGVLGAFYYLVNQATNAVTISNVGGITVQGGTPLTLGAGQAATLVATGATNASVAARGDLTDVTLGGTANTAPSQTASSGASLMTRELTDTRMVDYIMHAPNRFRNFTYAMASHISGTGTAVHAGPITEGRINVRIVNGSTNSFASVKVNRQGPWNGTEGSFGIDWSRPMSLAVMGSKNQITNNVTRAFLVFGAGGGDNDLPTNGHWVALNWVNPTNAEVLVSKSGVVTTNATTITTSASPLGFGLWIDHKTNGTGDIYYAERNSATSAALQKPTNATVTYSNGPMVYSTNQVSLTFGLVGLSTNTGASFEIVGLNNAVFFAP